MSGVVVTGTTCPTCGHPLAIRRPDLGVRCSNRVCDLRATRQPKGVDVSAPAIHPRQGQRCAACHAAFVFYPHERTGKLAPLIASADGNIAVNADGTYRILKKGETYEGQRYQNHFVDCPEASRFHRDDRGHEG